MTNTIPDTEEPELNFHLIWQILWRRKVTVLGLTSLFFLLAVIYVLIWPKSYLAVTTVKIPESSQDTADAIREMAFLPTSGDPIETHIEVAMTDKVTADVIDNLHLNLNPEYAKLSDLKRIWAVKSQVKVDNAKDSNLISIHTRAKTGKEAAELANAWAQSFIQVSQELSQESENAHYKFIHKQLEDIRQKLDTEKENKRNFLNQSNEVEADELVYKSLLEQDQESRSRASSGNTGIVVVDEASIPDAPASPKIITSIVLGTGAGFFFGILLAFARERIEDRIYDEQEISRIARAPLWAKIPLYREGSVNSSRPVHLVPETGKFSTNFIRSFKTLRASLLLSQPGSESVAFGLFSPQRGEGRTLVCAHLALALAQAGKKVLLIDADLGNPQIGTLFGVQIPDVSGLSRLLSGQASLKEVLRPAPGVANLMLLAAPPFSGDPAEIFDSSSMKKLVGEMKQKFDFVLFDVGPLLVSSDQIVLAMALDGVLLLAGYGQTRRSDVLEAVQQIQTARAEIWGIILNGVKN